MTAGRPALPENRIEAAVRELVAALLEMGSSSAPPARPPSVELLSPKEFGRRASLGRSSVYQALARGDVRSLRVGGRRLIASSELDRLAAESAGAASRGEEAGRGHARRSAAP